MSEEQKREVAWKKAVRTTRLRNCSYLMAYGSVAVISLVLFKVSALGLVFASIAVGAAFNCWERPKVSVG